MTEHQASLEPALGQRVAKALESLSGEGVNLPALLSILIPPPSPVEYKLPALPVITDVEQAAIDKLPDVFGKVAVTTRRLLEAPEISDLLREREVLDTIAALIEKRKEAIRTSALNHGDLMFEAKANGDKAMLNAVDRDKDGHYVVAAKFPGDKKTGKALSIEERGAKAEMTVDDLQRLVDDPEVPFTEVDFNAVTNLAYPPPPPLPRRVLVEQQAVQWMRSRPDGVEVMAKAVRRVPGTVSFNIRADK